MNRNRFAALAAATMISATSMGLVTAPAEADTSRAGCTVATPRGPKAAGRDDSNRVRLEWLIDVTCEKGRTIEVHQQRWEEDGPNGRGDDYIGDITVTRSFLDQGGSKRIIITSRLPQTKDSGGGTEPNEEMYQKVRFRVTEGKTTSEWTAFERGPASWIFH